MRILLCSAVLVACMLILAHTQAGAAMIYFDGPGYVVTGGGQVNVGLIFDYDDAVPGAQPAPNGLLCAGVRVSWDGNIAAVQSISDIHYNPAFDDTYFSLAEVMPSEAGYLAFVDFVFNPGYVPVMSTDLGHFTFTAGHTGGEMNLHVNFFYDKEGEESVDDFMDGQGNVLDSGITFGPGSMLTVIPEPLTILALAGGLAAVLARRRRASRA